MSQSPVKPFLKWAGNKQRIVALIRGFLPDGKRLIEPFVGSGAVFLNSHYNHFILGDTNRDLISLFVHLQKRGKVFIEYCKTYFVVHNNSQEKYYELRERFNTIDDECERAALFVYLNRHCFNGLCRYNSKGKFNVPFGKYKKPSFPETEMYTFWKKLQKATFYQAPFWETMAAAIPGDVVYCDPPYHALSKTANFTSYSDTPFGWAQQEQLAKMARELADRDIPVLISNHNTDEIRELYAGAQITEFFVQRFISCDGANRHKAPELLAYFAPTVP